MARLQQFTLDSANFFDNSYNLRPIRGMCMESLVSLCIAQWQLLIGKVLECFVVTLARFTKSWYMI